MMIVSPFLFTLLVATFAGADHHHKCDRNLCEVYKFLETKSNGQRDFEKNLYRVLRDIKEQLDHKLQESKISAALALDQLIQKIDKSELKITRMITNSERRMIHMMNNLNSEKLDPDINITTDSTKGFHTIRPYDCSDILKSGSVYSGVYSIFPRGEEVVVYCDMAADGGGWTVFLKRLSQPIQENFNRSWTDYRNGFGSARNEYWLGTELLHQMTTRRIYTMRTDVVNQRTHTKLWSEYENFEIASEDMKYLLTISGLTNDSTMTERPGFLYNNDQVFSTVDRDYDSSLDFNCAKFWGGFWHHDCSYHHPTAPYGNVRFNYPSKEASGPVADVEMKIRPRKWQ